MKTFCKNKNYKIKKKIAKTFHFLRKVFVVKAKKQTYAF
jgi:hypothetical protein